MFWRQIMLALPGAEAMPAPLLDRVGRIARGLQAQVEIFLSLYEPDILQSLERREVLEERISARIAGERRELERLADSLRAQGLHARVSVRWDYPMFEGVIRQVLRHRPDLLMLPAIRTHGVIPRTLAYREARLIEGCPCPLMLLKTPEVYSRGAVVAAVDPLHAHETPRDLDESIIGAAKTLSYALADAPVRIYHAVVPLRHAAPGDPPEVPAVSAREAERRAAAEARVGQMAARHDIPADCVHVESGRVEAALPMFARESHAQVIVMGAVSRSFPERALFGHTAEKVLDALACDVLVVKPAAFQCPVAADPAPAVPRPA
jgi:universal stress protein E